MYNFPHQINDVSKLHRALGVFAELEQKGLDLGDDSVVGIAMARAGVYAFRDKGRTLADALKAEAAKPRSSRGTETFARDLRRFFLLLGFLHSAAAGEIGVTPMGVHLLEFDATSADAFAVWRTALRHMSLVGDDGQEVSHPYNILLRLVEERPGIESPYLALALEARNDSESEFARILSLADLGDQSAVRDQTGASEAHWKNGSKILPALARQLGELRAEGVETYRSEGTPGPAEAPTGGRTAVGERGTARRKATRKAPLTSSGGSRKVTPETIARDPGAGRRPPDETEFADPAMTAELRRDRLKRHEKIVRLVGAALDGLGRALYEDPYDALATQAGEITLIVEVKTLDGSERDEIAQVRAAFAQLFYYEAFDVPSELRPDGLLKLAVFERPIAEDHVAFLESQGIAVATLNQYGKFVATGASALALKGAGIDAIPPYDEE